MLNLSTSLWTAYYKTYRNQSCNYYHDPSNFDMSLYRRSVWAQSILYWFVAVCLQLPYWLLAYRYWGLSNKLDFLADSSLYEKQFKTQRTTNIVVLVNIFAWPTLSSVLVVGLVLGGWSVNCKAMNIIFYCTWFGVPIVQLVSLYFMVVGLRRLMTFTEKAKGTLSKF